MNDIVFAEMKHVIIKNVLIGILPICVIQILGVFLQSTDAYAMLAENVI
jgi:hypothetical protein